LNTGDNIGANFTSLSVSFAALDSTVAAAAGASADAVAGASVDGEVSSDGAVSGTGGVGGADSSSILVSFVFSDMIAAAAAGAALDAVAVQWHQLGLECPQTAPFYPQKTPVAPLPLYWA
jgi:hypothetical protein